MHKKIEGFQDKIDQRIAWLSKFGYAGGTKRDIILLKCANELINAHNLKLIDLSVWASSKELVEEALGYELKDIG